MEQTKQPKLNDEKLTAANYVIGFYNTIQELIHIYSVYKTFLLKIEARHLDPHENILEIMDEQEDQQLHAVLEQVRYYIQTSHIQYKALKKKKEAYNKEKDEVTKIYNTLNTYVIKSQQLEEYLDALNDFLTDKVMTNLLQTSQDVLRDLKT